MKYITLKKELFKHLPVYEFIFKNDKNTIKYLNAIEIWGFKKNLETLNILIKDLNNISNLEYKEIAKNLKIYEESDFLKKLQVFLNQLYKLRIKTVKRIKKSK